ncbi:hypothetical protein OUZ56_013832 [Daphnia magna]|uniref:Uncharacterized protein n=1 Tax=Daphnia magna TaxID=35525 RepID=A0ABQ9Z727_9CRUS|nr:hypothetical protein OUZ56_013832 [Daphnia magna]
MAGAPPLQLRDETHSDSNNVIREERREKKKEFVIAQSDQHMKMDADSRPCESTVQREGSPFLHIL